MKRERKEVGDARGRRSTCLLPFPYSSSLNQLKHSAPLPLAMVQITVQHRSSSKPSSSRPSKPPVVIDFPHRHPNKVTVLELKGALEAKFPKVSTPVSAVRGDGARVGSAVEKAEGGAEATGRTS